MDELAIRRLRTASSAPRGYRCQLEADVAVTTIVRDLSARGAFVETAHRPPLGRAVRLHHPNAGSIEGEVSAHAVGGIAVAFAANPEAAGFALAVIASDMFRSAA